MTDRFDETMALFDKMEQRISEMHHVMHCMDCGVVLPRAKETGEIYDLAHPPGRCVNANRYLFRSNVGETKPWIFVSITEEPPVCPYYTEYSLRPL